MSTEPVSVSVPSSSRVTNSTSLMPSFISSKTKDDEFVMYRFISEFVALVSFKVAIVNLGESLTFLGNSTSKASEKKVFSKDKLHSSTLVASAPVVKDPSIWSSIKLGPHT